MSNDCFERDGRIGGSIFRRLIECHDDSGDFFFLKTALLHYFSPLRSSAPASASLPRSVNGFERHDVDLDHDIAQSIQDLVVLGRHAQDALKIVPIDGMRPGSEEEQIEIILHISFELGYALAEIRYSHEGEAVVVGGHRAYEGVFRWRCGRGRGGGRRGRRRRGVGFRERGGSDGGPR